MYDEIRQHIREGKTRLAFQEITELPLNRAQKDDLLLIESNYATYERSQLTETAEQRQITLNRINRDTLNLLNRIEAAQLEKAAGVVENRPTITADNTGDGGSGAPWKTILGVLGACLLAFAVFAFWPEAKQPPVKADISPATEVAAEKPSQPEPEKPNPGKTTPGDFKPSVTLPEGVATSRLKELQAKKTNIREIPTEAVLNESVIGKLKLSPMMAVVVYGSIGELSAGFGEYSKNMGEKIASRLNEKLPDLKVYAYDEDWRFFQSELMKSIRTGQYNDGTIHKFGGNAYLLVIEMKKSNNTFYRECDLKLLQVSDGKYLIKTSRSFRNEEESFQSVVDHIANKIEQRLN